MIAVMIARASFKSELRLEVTTIRSRENNPFQFCVDTDDAPMIAANDGACIYYGPGFEALPAPENTWLYRFARGGETVVVAWSLEESGAAELPCTARRATTRDGVEVLPPDGTRISVGPSPVYYLLED